MIEDHSRYVQVKQIVNEVDPFSLIVDGAPLDEYEAEIQKILSLPIETLNTESLALRIAEIFSESFGIPTYPVHSVVLDIAERINDLPLRSGED